ncbi:heavy metal translocating P-type ATPase [Anatilimnocola aggregata]|uniref:heavy metal translocating P-type ATPase n=1 Tax=Anatilimnocola aggregata TaxID=2528021 RepID=UPI00192E5827|nr:cation-translocating P-type ATPase [Anatilimnocola aggregata]
MPPSTTNPIRLHIGGMHCASCVGRVETALSQVSGVKSAAVNLALHEAEVRPAGDDIPVQSLIAAVERAGYQAEVIRQQQNSPTAPHSQAAEDQEQRAWGLRFLLSLAGLVPLVVIHFLPGGHHSSPLLGVTQIAIACLVQVFVGWPFLVSAAQRVRYAAVNMDTLIALGTTAALVAGTLEWITHRSGMSLMDGVMILTFVTLGRYLEARARRRTSRAIYQLMDLTPRVANIRRGIQVVKLSLDKVQLRDVLVIRPGERVPLDGQVISGHSDLNEAWLTGEALPVEKQAGDNVFAGTLNGSGSLEATVTKLADDTLLAQTIELVRHAQSSKASVQQLADRVVQWFVPAVLLIATATFIAWLVVSGGWQLALLHAVAVLVVACPCALGLATPTAIIVSSGAAAQRGIFIKSAAALEAANRVTTVVFDKTGTLTAGRPVLRSLQPAEHVSEERLLTIAAAIERLSNHPLVKAIVQAADSRQSPEQLQATALQVLPGEGIQADSSAGTIYVGNQRLLDRLQIVPGANQQNQSGEIRLHVVLAGKYLGSLVLQDQLAHGSQAAVAALQQLGKRIVLLTGDTRATAEAMAREAGIREVIADTKPVDKWQVIEQLKHSGEVVAMVGDGINDAPALAAADLGIALGNGADIAIESAEVVITQPDLRRVVTTLSLAQRTLSIIWQNLFWALIYNVILIPVAAGLLSPWGINLSPSMAAAAMAASSVCVVLNSLRLARL